MGILPKGLSMYTCVHVYSACRGQKKTSDPLGLQPQAVLSGCVGAGNWTPVRWEPALLATGVTSPAPLSSFLSDKIWGKGNIRCALLVRVQTGTVTMETSVAVPQKTTSVMWPSYNSLVCMRRTHFLLQRDAHPHLLLMYSQWGGYEQLRFQSTNE